MFKLLAVEVDDMAREQDIKIQTGKFWGLNNNLSTVRDEKLQEQIILLRHLPKKILSTILETKEGKKLAKKVIDAFAI